MVVLGATVTVMELPTALPYFAAIALLINLQLSVPQWLPLLVFYNIIFILPPLLLLGIRVGLGELVQGRFGVYREKLPEKSHETWLWIIGIVGFHLLWWTP
jgi:cytochrome c biogenesis protein CcdA